MEQDEADITISFSYQVRYGEVVIMEVTTYTWDRFLSNVGGQLGLWVGASVVSIVQLVHFVMKISYAKCRRYGECKIERMESGKRTGDRRMHEKPTVSTVNEQNYTYDYTRHF